MRGDAIDRIARNGKQQFEILAITQRVFDRGSACLRRSSMGRFADWDPIEFQLGSATAGDGHIQQIDPEPIADVGRSADDTERMQRAGEGQPRLEVQVFSENAAAERTRDENRISGLGSLAKPCAAHRCRTDRGEMDHEVTVPYVGISASDSNRVLFARFAYSFENLRSDFASGQTWQAEGQEDRDRRGGHAGQIAQIDRDEFPTNRARSAFRQQEMGPFAKGVGGYHPIGRGGSDQRAIVADAQTNLGQSRGPGFGPGDESVFHPQTNPWSCACGD